MIYWKKSIISGLPWRPWRTRWSQDPARSNFLWEACWRQPAPQTRSAVLRSCGPPILWSSDPSVLPSSRPPSRPWHWPISAQLSLPQTMDTSQRKVCRVWCYFSKLLFYICMEHWVNKGLGKIHIKLTGNFLSNYLRRMVEERFGRSFTHSFIQICINLIIYIFKFLEFLFLLLLSFVYNSWDKFIYIKVQKS